MGFNASTTSCTLAVARELLRQASQYFPSLKVVKRIASLLIDFLKESAREKETFKLSASPLLAGMLVVMSPIELINAITSG